MKTKISMKTIYLILVITIGLVGLGIGSTLAVFTASAEISNPISFSSNLSYDGDVFDTVEITIGPNLSQDVNFAIYNEARVSDLKYATWYIYDGSDSDIMFSDNANDATDSISPTGTSGEGVVYLKVINNTSNTITITMGVATSQDDIVLPSYMKLVSNNLSDVYSLEITKSTGIDTLYYKIGDATSYTASSKDVTVYIKKGTTYSFYGTPSAGYSITSCSASSPCSGTAGSDSSSTKRIPKTVSATVGSYNLTINKGTGVSRIYYKVNGASSYSYSTSSKTVSVQYGTTYYYYGTASSGYTMSSCTSSSPCSGTMGASAVTKSLTATASSYSLTLSKGTGVSTIYYKINGASSYTSSTSSSLALSVQSGTKYYYYGTASSGYVMSSCTASSPCSGTMGTSAVTKSLTAVSSDATFTVTLVLVTNASNTLNTKTVTVGDSYSYSFVIPSGYKYSSLYCTNNQTAKIASSTLRSTVTISSVTADTTCTVVCVDSSGGAIA